MSREILFRAKTIKDNEWVQGAYCHYDDIKDNGKDDCDYIIEKHNGECFPFKEVIPETIGQFTGLTDKNGEKIFEGDIIRQQTFHKLPLKYDSEKAKKDHIEYLIKKCGAIFDNEEHYHKDYIWEVEFENARFYPFADDNFEWGNFDWNTPFEVIGNIFENEELLQNSK